MMITETSLKCVDAFWAKEQLCSIEDLSSSQARIIPQQNPNRKEYVSLFQRNDFLQIKCSPSLFDIMTNALQTVDRKTIFEARVLQNLIADRIDAIIGPAYIGYADMITEQPKESFNIKHLSLDDYEAFNRFTRELSELDLEHSGLDQSQPIAYCLREGDIIAAAGYKIWGECIAHIGVATHPAHRGNGIGRAVVRRIAEYAIKEGLVAQYRTLVANQPSIKIAQTLGFEEYARTIYIRANAA